MSQEYSEKFSASAAERISAAMIIVAATGIAGLIWWFNPSNVNFLPVCPLYKMTGLACPGCGMTRGLHALLHGDILTALDYNLLLPPILFFFGYLFVSLFLTIVRGRGLNFKLFGGKVLWGFFAIMFIFTVLRNLPFYPFNILYP